MFSLMIEVFKKKNQNIIIEIYEYIYIFYNFFFAAFQEAFRHAEKVRGTIVIHSNLYRNPRNKKKKCQ